MIKNYDPKCWLLADLFLHDCDMSPTRHKQLTHELALEIQRTIEDFISAEVSSPHYKADESVPFD